MRTDTTIIASLPPALIGAALDCLAQLPDCQRRLDPSLLVCVARVIGCSNTETAALIARIRASAIVMNDPRWPEWSASFKAVADEQRQALDASLLWAIAALPLTRDLNFNADDFFDALLASAASQSRA